MRRVVPLLVLLAACDAKPPAPAAVADAPVSTGARDYEGAARALYAGEEGYEAKWPVEFCGLRPDLATTLWAKLPCADCVSAQKALS